MNKITFIIPQNYDISAITSLLQCNNDSWECFIINNSVKNFDQYIIGNKQFKILNDSSNQNILYDAINRASGEYILILDAKDIVVSDIIMFQILLIRTLLNLNQNKNIYPPIKQ